MKANHADEPIGQKAPAIDEHVSRRFFRGVPLDEIEKYNEFLSAPEGAILAGRIKIGRFNSRRCHESCFRSS